MTAQDKKLQSVDSYKKPRLFHIELRENLFTENWVCEAQEDWNGHYIMFDDGEEFHTHHLEFNGPKEGLISETGYRSHFITTNGKLNFKPDDLEVVIKMFVNREFEILNIKEVEDAILRNS